MQDRVHYDSYSAGNKNGVGKPFYPGMKSYSPSAVPSQKQSSIPRPGGCGCGKRKNR